MKIFQGSPRLSSVVLLLLAVTATISRASWADPAKGISPASKAIRDGINLSVPDGCSHIFGFNYQPSWGHDGMTVWGEKFNVRKYRAELTQGKNYFPKFNAVRIWLSWSAYRADREEYIRKFQQAVDICGELDLLVLPVIFNRWVGGPLWDRVKNEEITGKFDTSFAPFIQALVAPMKGDQRILAWDLCNEPCRYDYDKDITSEQQIEWLRKVRDEVKRCDPQALTCVGTMPSLEWLKMCAPFQDILTPHLYYPLYAFDRVKKEPKELKLEDSAIKADLVAQCVDFAKGLGKPLMSTECCWGAFDDDVVRAGIVRTNLQILKKHGIAFFPHALYTSGVADLHIETKKPFLNMPFILGDGSLRPGHAVYNEFTESPTAPRQSP